jgi:cytochrome oxidase Cu insertion factor (SCO1/SenC/PrrC family)
MALAIAAALLITLLGFAGALIAQRASQDQAGSGPPSTPYRGSIPPPGLHARAFSLRSYHGGRVTMRALRGKVVLLTFLDSACREKCPLIAGIVGRALPLLPAGLRRNVRALAISVQPRVDTPAHVRSFLRQRHALALDFLIGSVRELRPVWKAYGILSAVESGNADVHSADVRVFDRRGIWVSTLHAGVDLTPPNLAHDLLVALSRKTTRMS